MAKIKSDLQKVMSRVSMIQIPENALLDGVVKALSGREMFVDADNSLNERIYSGDVAEQILGEVGEGLKLDKKTISQLEELVGLIDSEYFQITNI